MVNWPKSTYQTIQTGTLDDLNLYVISAGKGLNTQNLTKLSTRGKLIHLNESDHYVPFHKIYSNLITDCIFNLLENK
jgi:hypothetical protein